MQFIYKIFSSESTEHQDDVRSLRTPRPRPCRLHDDDDRFACLVAERPQKDSYWPRVHHCLSWVLRKQASQSTRNSTSQLTPKKKKKKGKKQTKNKKKKVAYGSQLLHLGGRNLVGEHDVELYIQVSFLERIRNRHSFSLHLKQVSRLDNAISGPSKNQFFFSELAGFFLVFGRVLDEELAVIQVLDGGFESSQRVHQRNFLFNHQIRVTATSAATLQRGKLKQWQKNKIKNNNNKKIEWNAHLNCSWGFCLTTKIKSPGSSPGASSAWPYMTIFSPSLIPGLISTLITFDSSIKRFPLQAPHLSSSRTATYSNHEIQRTKKKNRIFWVTGCNELLLPCRRGKQTASAESWVPCAALWPWYRYLGRSRKYPEPCPTWFHSQSKPGN